MTRATRLALELALLAALIAPIFVPPFFASVDGAAHLAIARIAVALAADADSAFAALYELNPGPHPNLLVYGLLALGQSLLPAVAAERALLCLMAAFLWLSSRYCFAAVGSRAWGAQWLAALLFYNSTLYLGFYNFNLGISCFFLIVGLQLRHAGCFTPPVLGAGVLLCLAAYATHVVALAVSCAALALLGLGEAAMLARKGARPALARLARLALWSLLLAFPALLLLAAAVLPQSEDFGAGLAQDAADSVARRLRQFALGASLAETPLLIPAIGLPWVLAAGVALALGRRGFALPAAWPFLLLALGLFLLYLLTPSQLGLRWVAERLAVYAYAALALLLAALAPAGGRRLALATGLLAVFALAVGSVARFETARALTPYLAEARQALATTRAGETVLTLRLDVPEMAVVERTASQLMIQAGGYAVALNDSLDVKLYQAASPFFPIRFRSEADPYRRWAHDRDFVGPVPTPDLARFEAATGLRLDRIVVFGAAALEVRTDARRLAAAIEAGHELAYTSSPLGFARVYARRRGGP